jgi:hypothetical protein
LQIYEHYPNTKMMWVMTSHKWLGFCVPRQLKSRPGRKNISAVPRETLKTSRTMNPALKSRAGIKDEGACVYLEWCGSLFQCKGMAAEGRRTPRRWRAVSWPPWPRSVLECSSPLELWRRTSHFKAINRLDDQPAGQWSDVATIGVIS